MKVCVCGDSHGNPEGIARMLRQERPHALLYLGDGVRDLQRADIPRDMQVAAVEGNCDLASTEPLHRIINLLGRTIYMCHGHYEKAKLGFDGLRRAGARHGAHVVLYGHTHTADVSHYDGRVFINPGAMRDRENRYAVLWQENGVLWHDLRYVKW